jgi:hypothetical protein
MDRRIGRVLGNWTLVYIWNEAGHAMAAELIANRLCPR